MKKLTLALLSILILALPVRASDSKYLVSVGANGWKTSWVSVFTADSVVVHDPQTDMVMAYTKFQMKLPSCWLVGTFDANHHSTNRVDNIQCENNIELVEEHFEGIEVKSKLHFENATYTVPALQVALAQDGDSVMIPVTSNNLWIALFNLDSDTRITIESLDSQFESYGNTNEMLLPTGNIWFQLKPSVPHGALRFTLKSSIGKVISARVLGFIADGKDGSPEILPLR